MHRITKLFGGALGGLLITATPAFAEHQFQLKNCRPVTDTYHVYNADDTLGMAPYMSFELSSIGEVKTGKCKGEGEGYCRVFALGAAQWFHVQTTKTVYQGEGSLIREYSGLLDCKSKPSE